LGDNTLRGKKLRGSYEPQEAEHGKGGGRKKKKGGGGRRLR